MPRRARAIQAGLIYHVLNRGNGRMRIYYKENDYAAFRKVLAEGQERYPVDLLAYCLMGNHWHLVLRPRTDRALSDFMRWVGVTHVRRHHQHYHHRAGGHLYQGRFKSFPVQDDAHLLTLLRYVEANPLRARIVSEAESWEFSSLWQRGHGGKNCPQLSAWPIARPGNWRTVVNQAMDQTQLEQLRTSVARGRPFGEEDWVRTIVKKLGLQFTLNSLGRPRKKSTISCMLRK